MGTPVKVTAILSGPLCGEPPHLDAILEWQAAMKAESISRGDLAGWHAQVGDYRGNVQRCLEAPRPGTIAIPIERRMVAAWPIAKCSSPILAPCQETVEYLNKRLDAGEIGPLLGGSRRSIHHGTGDTRAYHIPCRIRPARAVVWFAVAYGFTKGRVGRRRNAVAEIRKALREITSIGARRQAGFGRVAQWIVEPIDKDWSWFAASPRGMVLMRPLPAFAVPGDTIGCRLTVGAVCSPYWHPHRAIDIMTPC